MEITFCCTNIDLYSQEEFNELERLGLPLQAVHCLGLCHYCAQGKMALVDDAVIVADSSEAFWLVLFTEASELSTATRVEPAPPVPFL